MNRFTITPVYFLVPGNINNLTGGYAYDRSLLAELHQLGLNIQLVKLADSFPHPDTSALRDANFILATLPDNSVVIVDGLAFGAMDELAQSHAQRLKFIALCHHPLALEAGISEEKQKSLRVSEQLALANSRAVVVTSKNTARILAEEFSVPFDKISIALPGTDAREFALCDGQPPVLLTVATLTRRKAHDVLIDALALLKEIPWQARFVGSEQFDPEWANYLRSKVSSLALKNRILFLGNREDISDEYRNADIFVLPSLFEGYGMAFAEALSFGLPIIAAHTGAVPDLVPSSTGILIPPADVNALAGSLMQLLTDSTKRKQLQLGAQSAAQNLPKWVDTAEVVFQLIQKVSH
jgi:glycosyltransferase involved in cell wall biosynthesis